MNNFADRCFGSVIRPFIKRIRRNHYLHFPSYASHVSSQTTESHNVA